ncbi:MAG: crotonase/enoyl-CoA hydratase family protein [Solirubrobacterales bacterium]|nr:crotonase/enoyl-CoA hydratase family protein [Solirubrobacterales bacterium]
MDLVTWETRGTTAILTIDRPERRNAVDTATAGELLAGLRRFEADDELLVMVLTGAGDQAFCAGADLKAVAAAGSVPGDVVAAVAGRPEGPMGFTRLTAAKPVIAAIGGWCLAGGLELALWCDLRIASRSSRLGYPERRWGVPLIDGGTLRLPRIVGLGRALDLILTGRIIDAGEALEWGLLTEVVDDGDHLERALEIAEGIARFPQTTMLSDRRSAIEGSTLPLAESLEFEKRVGLESVQTGIEGAARFAGGEGRGGEGAGV